MTEFHGNPCWFELGTGDLDGAQRFYAEVLGWQIADAGMDGFTYLLAQSDGDMVAGMMALEAQAGPPPPNWTIYLAAGDCDHTAAQITAAGGTVLKGPADIPGTGRFAVATDPQGAVFGILQPDMSTVSEAELRKAREGGAFNQRKVGHGNWIELMSSDPESGFEFYSSLFGWTRGQAMDMGEMGTYQLFRRGGTDIGAVMRLGDAPQPAWLPYFGIEGVDAVIARINAAGGRVAHGPQEVPSGAFIAVATDPQGAWFAVVGPR